MVGLLRRRVFWCALWAAILVLPWIHIELFTPPPGRVELPQSEPNARLRVYTVAWGYHASLVVEQPSGWRLGPPGAEDAPFVEYGWGDRRFMMESNYWPHAILAALFLPTESVVYIRAHDRPPDESYPGFEMYCRELGADEFRALATVLETEITRSADGARPEAFPPVPEYSGRFYPGRRYYIFWSNCNSWTVNALRDSGLPVSPSLVFFDNQVGGRLEGFDRCGGAGR